MKTRLRVPQLTWREETVDVPKGRVEAVKEGLRARQALIVRQMAKGNEDAARQLDAAASTGGMSRVLVRLGLGALLGTFAGLLITPVKGSTARSKVGQYLGKAGEQATGAAQAARSRAGAGQQDGKS